MLRIRSRLTCVLYGTTPQMTLMALRQTAAIPSRYAQCAALLCLAFAGSACADRIVSLDAGSGSRLATARVGDIVDIRLWGGGLGTYASPPIISTPVIEFVGVTLETGSGGVVNPGGPTQRFRFRAVSRGSAIVTFSPLQSAPIVIDTIVVQ
jgi:hypothetical protein